MMDSSYPCGKKIFVYQEKSVAGRQDVRTDARMGTAAEDRRMLLRIVQVQYVVFTSGTYSGVHEMFNYRR